MLVLTLLLSLLQPTTQPDTDWTVLDSSQDPQVHFVVFDHPDIDESGTIDVLVHLKGSPNAIARSVERVGRRPMLVVVSDPGFSSVYTERFADPQRLQTFLDEGFAALAEAQSLKEKPTEGQLLITSFSAGFGGVRELLKHDEWFDRIDGLLMLDSIYAGFSDPDNRVVSAENMAGFRRFAKAAAAGEKTMIVTHSRYTTPTYASTWETADDLLAYLDLESQPADEWIADGLHVDRTASEGKFRLVGTTADDGSDHGRILSNMHLWLPELFGDE